MTEKTYWLVDAAGRKCLVTGAVERDRWLPLGWSDADEPVGDEFVWVHHAEVAEPGRLPVSAWREVWQAKGWQAGPPPEPVDPLTGARRPAPTPPVAAEVTTQAKPAAGGEKETKTRG